jgi:hypothetical protein
MSGIASYRAPQLVLGRQKRIVPPFPCAMQKQDHRPPPFRGVAGWNIDLIEFLTLAMTNGAGDETCGGETFGTIHTENHSFYKKMLKKMIYCVKSLRKYNLITLYLWHFNVLPGIAE